MKKRIMLFLLILMSIYAISQVSAEDNLEFICGVESQESVNLEIGEDSQILDDSCQIDCEDCTADKIQNKIDLANEGDTIYLNGTFEFDKSVSINKSLTIEGMGDGAIIKSESFSFVDKFFSISASNVILNNLKFVGSTTSSNIFWQGDYGIIKNCIFNDNSVSNKKAGALYLSGSNCNLSDCTFTNNHAGCGGAVYVEGRDNKITFCQFNENNVVNDNAEAGAVYSNCENLFIDYCNFTDNYASSCAGAVFINSKKNTISHSNFYNNYIRDSNSTGGGAVFSNGEGLTVDNCTFINNKAIESNGGAVYINADYNFVKFSTFKDNTADEGKDIYSNVSSNVMSNYFSYKLSEKIEDLIWGISASDLENIYNNNFTIIKEDSTISFISTGIIFEYGAVSDPIRITVNGGSVTRENIKVLNNDKSKTVNAKIDYSNGILKLSGLNVGEYVLRVTTVPDENHYSIYKDLTITVKKATAVIKASKITVALKKGSKWTVKLINSKNGKAISNMKLTLKVYTGKKYKTVTVTTNYKGEASYSTKKLSKGTHKVIVSGKDSKYNFNTLSSSISVVKQKAIKFKVQKSIANDGAQLLIQVLIKKTKKPINGAKIKLLIKNGKKYKTVTLKTKKYKGKKGIAGYSTNKLTVGNHKVKILSNTIIYSGSATSAMKITKKAKKRNPWETKISA